MILGVGVDIVDVERIAERMGDKQWVERIFHESEMEDFTKMNASSVAGRFAAKEAVSKALGIPLRLGDMLDIRVYRTRGERPRVELHNEVKKRLHEVGARRLHLSISHDKDKAIAFVVVDL